MPQHQDRIRYYPMFPWAIPNSRADHLRVTHPFATLIRCKHLTTVRLACLKRAASVRSEPGSNSPSYSCPSEEEQFYSNHLDPARRRSPQGRTALLTTPSARLLFRVSKSHWVFHRVPYGNSTGPWFLDIAPKRNLFEPKLWSLSFLPSLFLFKEQATGKAPAT